MNFHVDINNILWQHVDMSNIKVLRFVLSIVHVLQGLVSAAVAFLLFGLANHFGPKQITEVAPVVFLPVLFALFAGFTAFGVIAGLDAKVPSILCSLVFTGLGILISIIYQPAGAAILLLGIVGLLLTMGGGAFALPESEVEAL
jgi:hypothetical protein